MNTDGAEILLVEANPLDVELTLHALLKENRGNRIHVVRDGEEALEFLFCRGAYRDRSFKNPPKLVVLDLKLPKLNGLEVLREIKVDTRTRSIPVAVLTSSNEDRDLVQPYKMGVNSYIQKPLNFEQFRETVKQLGLYWLVVNHCPPRQARFRGSSRKVGAEEAGHKSRDLFLRLICPGSRKQPNRLPAAKMARIMLGERLPGSCRRGVCTI
jgi:CheY-like chemotaxis protein